MDWAYRMFLRWLADSDCLPKSTTRERSSFGLEAARITSSPREIVGCSTRPGTQVRVSWFRERMGSGVRSRRMQADGTHAQPGPWQVRGGRSTGRDPLLARLRRSGGPIPERLGSQGLQRGSAEQLEVSLGQAGEALRG